MDETWIRLGASLAIGLLIGLERERNPSAKAGVRTFALLALFGTLAAMLGEAGAGALAVPVGLAAVAATLIAAHLRDGQREDSGTTTVAAACVCYLLGALAGIGETTIAGALGIGVTALLYFKPEIEGVSTALERHEQVSVLQFLVASFIVLPLLPDRGFGPYEVLNPRNVWLMVVLISGIGLASHMALRIAGERHGTLLTGILGGLVSSTATTVLYARRSAESDAMRPLAAVVVPLANLVPLARIALITGVLAPSLLVRLAPVLGAAMAAGLAVTALSMRGSRGASAPVPESRNPAELGVALRFAGLYAAVLLASAWLSDVAGSHGLYAAAAASGLVDIDPIVLSSLNLFAAARLGAAQAVVAIALAYASNVAFKLGVLLWFDRRLALRAGWALAATIAGGGAALLAALPAAAQPMENELVLITRVGDSALLRVADTGAPANVDDAYDRVVAARRALQQAEMAQEQGVEPREGERQGVASGRSRLTDEYWHRQERLTQDVEAARKQLDQALARWRAVR